MPRPQHQKEPAVIEMEESESMETSMRLMPIGVMAKTTRTQRKGAIRCTHERKGPGMYVFLEMAWSAVPSLSEMCESIVQVC